MRGKSLSIVVVRYHHLPNPVMKDHLCFKTTFVDPKGLLYIWVLTVVYIVVYIEVFGCLQSCSEGSGGEVDV